MIKNGDMPASPQVDDLGCGTYGLTKREMFAMHAMQGMLACEPNYALKPEDYADSAVLMADALLKRLEESE